MTVPQDAWHLDSFTLREIVDDRPALEALLDAPATTPSERVWLLRVLGHVDQAIGEGEQMLAARATWRDLLLVAHAYQWLGDFAHAAVLQRRALALADSPVRLARTHQQIGKRLFDEGRLEAALLAFEEALAMRGLVGDEVVADSRQAIERVHALLHAGVS